MERVGKGGVGMLTGQADPTIIPPPQYRKRFSLAMERYFMTVPDKWIAYDRNQLGPSSTSSSISANNNASSSDASNNNVSSPTGSNLQQSPPARGYNSETGFL